MAGRNEKKNITKSKIVNYIINNKITSKAELAQNLSLSMPTVLSNVNELVDRNMVIEIGEYESTGGRKAKRIGINPAYKYAVGVVITANHLGIVLLNMQYEIEKTIRIRKYLFQKAQTEILQLQCMRFHNHSIRLINNTGNRNSDS